uniref:LIM zinc-binding domain-containing protein n=1 Tax=Cynoglossus semilaevis TaxID=244447 RepID=A0A3P8WSS4_CYNSE
IRAFPPSGDKCHECEKRVYMVERICAEGLYFHRECFRCSTCSSTLRQGAHAFDSENSEYLLIIYASVYICIYIYTHIYAYTYIHTYFICIHT